MNQGDKTSKWTCNKCGAVLIYEISTNEATITSINKQKAKTRFISFTAKCKKCGNEQAVKSNLLRKLYNVGFQDGFDYAINMAKLLDIDHQTFDSIPRIDWVGSGDVDDDKYLLDFEALLDEEEKTN